MTQFSNMNSRSRMNVRFGETSGTGLPKVTERHSSKAGRDNEANSPTQQTEYSETGDVDGEASITNVYDLGFSLVPPQIRTRDDTLVRDTATADRLLKAPYPEPKTGTTVKEWVRKEIKRCLVHGQSDHYIKDGRFVPIDKLYMILSVETIMALLKEEYPFMNEEGLASELKEYLSRRRILGILIFMYPTHLRLFESFVRDEITDDELPLTSMGSTHEFGFQTRSMRENTITFKEWEENDITLFYVYQPIFLAPFFDFQGVMPHNYLLNEEIRLPWLKCEYKARGGNGMVHRVEIHPSHHNFKSNQSSSRPLYFALKEISSPDEEIYRLELLALAKVPQRRQEHLISLLLTFKHGARRYFLFEWADSNLWDFWAKYYKGSRDAVVSPMWMAEQCLGLATAVKQIHGLTTWQKLNEPPDTDEKVWGRHGDIKPHNILAFSSDKTKDYRLVLSDLGLTRYHSSVTRSRVSPTSLDGFTGLYRPPDELICSKYDIWSLGCVFLEFCTWWLKGFRSVQDFESERTKPDGTVEVLDDPVFDIPKYFFISKKDGNSKAQVKGVVLTWIETLRSCTNGDLFAEPMLNLIEDNMLVVDKNNRFSIDLVCAEIKYIVNQMRRSNSCEAPSPALLYSEHSVSGNRGESHENNVKKSNNLRIPQQQKEFRMEPARVPVNYLPLPAGDFCDLQLSNRGLDSTIGTSSNGDTTFETSGSLMTADTISLDGSLASKHAIEIKTKVHHAHIISTDTEKSKSLASSVEMNSKEALAGIDLVRAPNSIDNDSILTDLGEMGGTGTKPARDGS
ncbi:kinase-like domain-containing protein [Nemania sp. FL0916]|nr:kinase-like domain-containing protein [Nemania sp. FL0916]